MTDLRPEMRDARLLQLVTIIKLLPTEIPPGPPSPSLLNQPLLLPASAWRISLKPTESIRNGKLAELSLVSNDVKIIFILDSKYKYGQLSFGQFKVVKQQPLSVTMTM